MKEEKGRFVGCCFGDFHLKHSVVANTSQSKPVHTKVISHKTHKED